ncbi:MAG: hypothetical protein QM783_07495 [Phycisphaerales bacterium]
MPRAGDHRRSNRLEPIASLYAQLNTLTPSPVIELNRAVAIGMGRGPGAGLELVDTLATDPALRDYSPLAAVRADLLFKLGRLSEAKTEFERAASLTWNHRERDVLTARAESCGNT